MRIITFNVNGIRSIHTKSKTGEKSCPLQDACLNKLIEEQKPDILCLQEIRCQNTKELDCYKTQLPYVYSNHSTATKGYSGTAILCRTEPLSVSADFARFPDIVPSEYSGLELFREGRMLSVEYANCFVVCVYTPNSKGDLTRLPQRLLWDSYFAEYLRRLQSTKKVVVCGDLNCAHLDIDIFATAGHSKSPGFTPEERKSFSTILESVGLVDTYRFLKPTEIKYTYWSNFAKSRERNRGWRIDYVLVSKDMQQNIVSADCLTEYFGSDHCPVIAEITV